MIDTQRRDDDAKTESTAMFGRFGRIVGGRDEPQPVVATKQRCDGGRAASRRLHRRADVAAPPPHYGTLVGVCGSDRVHREVSVVEHCTCVQSEQGSAGTDPCSTCGVALCRLLRVPPNSKLVEYLLRQLTAQSALCPRAGCRRGFFSSNG